MIALLLFLAGVAQRESGADQPRVLFLTHSAGFVHDVVKRPAPEALSLAEEALTRASRGRFALECTQDCGAITGDNLARARAVVFYTTGELPIAEEGKTALMSWLAAGGAFVGIHCATDTFYQYPPYVAMIGGTFDGHPWHEEVTVDVEEAAHPAVAHLGSSFAVTDEIYQFKNFRRHPQRVLLALDTGSVDATLGNHADGDYALSWTRDWGEGRVFYTALGHRAEVWQEERYLQHVLAGIQWALDGPDLACAAAQGAVVLLDGSSAGDGRAWTHRDGTPFGWKRGTLMASGPTRGSVATREEVVEVVPGTGDLVSKADFGDALIHVEFSIPAMPGAEGQARGNSGVYVQGRYEVQVLDSHGLTSGLGDCGAIYGKRMPDVNACRGPERWQGYDIEFRAPRFDAEGEKSAHARLTVWHNGRLIHDDVEVDGPTAGGLEGPEQARGPLLLQDQGNPVRYRNVWVLPR